MPSVEVTPSGSVGKQVYATGSQSAQVTVQKVTLAAAPSSAAVLVVRDGNASGETVFTANLLANTTRQFSLCHKFQKGMHVKVTPGNAKAYLIIK